MSKSKATVSINVHDATTGVGGVIVTLTDVANSQSTFTSGQTGSAGGATINNVPYGEYKITLDMANAGAHTAPATIDNLVVDSSSETLNVTVN